MKRNVVLVLAAMAAISCGNPVHERATGYATLRVNATLPGSDASRTVVPNFNAEVDDIVVRLASNDGYDAPADQHATGGPDSWATTFSVPVGSWHITALAYRQGVQVGSGSVDAELTTASNLPVTITITFGVNGEDGSLRFAVTFPDTLGIDYVHGQIENVAELIPVWSSSGGLTQCVFTHSSLPAGTYSLVLTFKRGDNYAGVFREKILVSGGFESGSWVKADGSLASERAFAEDEFFETNTALSGLSINGVLLSTDFDSKTFTYAKGPIADLPANLTITATGSLTTSGSKEGQYLRSSWNNGTLAEIPNGSSWTSPTTAEDNTLVVQVTAADRATTQDYTVTFSKGYRVTYLGNGNSGGSAPADSTAYPKNAQATVMNQGTLTRTNWTFINWNTQADGLGTSYKTNDKLPIGTANIPLYAHWVQNGTVNVTCLLNPTYKSITFAVPSVTVSRSGQLLITGSPSGATNWNWYLDNEPLASNTSSIYTWTVPSNQQPGHYTINVDALYYDATFRRNVVCTGSFRVTVTY